MRGSMDYCQGGGGPGPTARNQPGQRFLGFCFFSLHAAYFSLHRGSNGLIAEKTMLSQGSRGGPTFSRGGGIQLFPGGGGGSKC